MAAEAYARVTGSPGVLNVTTGPGGINALNGVFGAWTDSVPMLVISGQVKRETCMRSQGITGLRQLGDQEADIIAMVEKITKYAVMIDDPLTIRYHLERAWHLAQNGRPGPCWLDIPVDVQATNIDPATLRAYDPATDELSEEHTPADAEKMNSDCREILAAHRERKTASDTCGHRRPCRQSRRGISRACTPAGRTRNYRMDSRCDRHPMIRSFADARARSGIAPETSRCKVPICS